MTGDEPTDMLRASVKTTYTFNEAIEEMKRRDRNPTTRPIQWVDAKTGKPVYIGYNN